MQIDLTQGPITRTMLRFAVPMICGNLLQQLYNVVDTLIVGQYLGANALAAVGSAYTLMTFLTSIFLGLCMGSGAVFAIRYGEKNMDKLKEDMYVAFILTAGLTLLINLFIFWKLDMILHFLSVPQDVYPLMRTYLWAVFWGIVATFLYREFYGTIIVPWCRGCHEYHIGPCLYTHMSYGRSGGCMGYCNCTVDIGSWNFDLYQSTMPMVESGT